MQPSMGLIEHVCTIYIYTRFLLWMMHAVLQRRSARGDAFGGTILRKAVVRFVLWEKLYTSTDLHVSDRDGKL